MLRKFTLIVILALLPFYQAFAQQRLELGFFADQQTFNVEERKQLVKFLEKHKPGNKYEFELLSLSDPLKLGIDNQRFLDIEALFRQYGININGLLSAQIRFIASNEQKLVVIRKTKQDIKNNEKH